MTHARGGVRTRRIDVSSILQTIKKLLGISESQTNFDTDIIVHINSALSTLTDLGVGPSEGFMITDDYSSWEEFIPTDGKNFEMVKSYIYLRVKLLFDPPLSSSVLAAIERTISEFEWRLNVKAETK